MDLHDDRNGGKDRMLEDIGKSIKLVQQFAVCGVEPIVLGNDSWLAHSLCHLLDVALRHGLRDLQRGYWPMVRELSHSDTLQLIHALKRVSTPLGKGRAWLRLTLTEGSLQSYLGCLGLDSSTLRRHYTAPALLRDESRTQQLLTLLAGLEQVQFQLDPDVAFLDLDAPPQAELPCMTSSLTSSLASPVDSGVALLDSDADGISVSEATINEGDTLSFREEELEDNRINNQLLTLDVDSIGENAKEDIPLQTPAITISPTLNNVQTSVTSDTMNLNAEYNRILREKVSKDMINSGDIKNQFVRDSLYHPFKNDSVHSGATESQSEEIVSDDGYLSRQSSDKSMKCGPDIRICNRPHSQTTVQCNRTNYEYDRMSQSCMAYLECCNEVEKENKCHTDNLLVDNKQLVDSINIFDGQKQDSNIMSVSTGCDGTVTRRQRKKKREGSDVKVKRVSFHEDFIKQHKEQTADFSVSFLPPNSVIKRDVVKGRYSWCAEGDAPFVARHKNETDTKSDVYLSSSTLTSSEEVSSDNSTSNNGHNLKDSSNNLIKGNEKLACIKTGTVVSKTPPVAERGTPEGQEDPPKTSSNMHLNNIGDTNSYHSAVMSSSTLKKFPSIASSIDLSDTESDPGEWRSSSGYMPWKTRGGSRRLSSGFNSKTSLLHRFMRSLTEKKFVQRKLKLVKPSRQLYIKGAKPGPSASEQFLCEMAAEARLEVPSSSPELSYPVTPHMEEAFRVQVFKCAEEKLYKLFKVSSSYLAEGQSYPMLALLTDCSLYLVGLQSTQAAYHTHLALPYQELDAILVGPNGQTLLVSSRDHSQQFLVESGERLVTEQLVSHLEMAMRRSPVRPLLPAVRQLALSDMKKLLHALQEERTVLEEEHLCHYSLVRIQDDHLSPPTTPLGPVREGHLMFRPAAGWPLQPWEPGYFMLKGGVLYMFGERGQRLPKRVIPLHAGHCHGCRRLLPQQQQRPHTFEIVLGHQRSLQFAAADEYEASDWLQALVQAASGLYEVERAETVPCSLVLSSKHIVTCREQFPATGVQTLACAAIADLAAFGLSTSAQSWCILEFACREVHETSGDWVLYFASATELAKFREALEQLWPQLMESQFPAHTISDEVLHHRCMETSRQLAAGWDALLPQQ